MLHQYQCFHVKQILLWVLERQTQNVTQWQPQTTAITYFDSNRLCDGSVYQSDLVTNLAWQAHNVLHLCNTVEHKYMLKLCHYSLIEVTILFIFPYHL